MKMYNSPIRVLAGLLLVFLTVGMQDARACLSLQTSTMQVGQSQTVTATIGADAYYWSVTGPLTIVGSRKGSSVTIEATGAGVGTVSYTYFQNGQCYTCTGSSVSVASCAHTIVEWIPMCYESSANCYQKRGDYSIRDCNGNSVYADWEVTPNSGGTCIYYGCTTPGTSRFYSTNFKPHPVCNWTGLNVTVRAYVPGTNTLLASYTTTIQDCGFGGPGFGKRANGYTVDLPGTGDVSVEAVDLLTGNRIPLDAKASATGTYQFQTTTDQLKAGRMYMVVVKQNGKVITRQKILAGE